MTRKIFIVFKLYWMKIKMVKLIQHGIGMVNIGKIMEDNIGINFGLFDVVKREEGGERDVRNECSYL